MPRKLALIHTVARLTAMYDELCGEIMPEIERFHIADEGLLHMLLTAKGMTPTLHRRFIDDAACAEEVGADMILLTCSSISPSVDVACQVISIPILKIDEPMAEQAVALGRRIGVLATAETTLGPTSGLIASCASKAGKTVDIDAVLAEGAHKLMLAGQMERHDELVRSHLLRIMESHDVVVLAQGSMARVAEQIPTDERRVPILSSPRSGVERARDVIRQ